jgi:mannose-1-phosphate guanylyltransferase
MRAVVLVGGEGTRLRPLTETIKKELLPLMDRAVLHHTLDHLSRHGVHEVILSSSYLEDTFRSFIEARRGDPTITWITETEPLGTGGAIVNALASVGTGEPFLALNGDIVTDLDVTAMVAAHRTRGAAATIALAHVDDARAFGLVATQADGRVMEFREKPQEPVPGDINAGTYVLEPSALSRWEPGSLSIERDVFPALIAEGLPVYGFSSDAYWIDLGTPEKYLQAHFDMLDGKVGSAPHYATPFVADSAAVQDGARLGRRTVVCARARIERGAVLEDSVVHPHAVVEEGATVRSSILGPRSRVGAGAVVNRSVLAEGAAVPAGVALDDARVSAGQVAAPTERTGAPDRMG